MPDNYSSNYIPSYKGNILTKTYIENMSLEEKDNAVNDVFTFYRQHGFPYVKFDKNGFLNDFLKIKNYDTNKICNGNILTVPFHFGSDIVKYFCPHIYECKTNNKKPSIIECFNSDELLKKVIRNRLDNAENGLTSSNLKNGISNSCIAFKASMFNSLLAKFIYLKFTSKNDIIYDYSMGYGQRLIGALSLPYPITYIGTDPCEKTCIGNKNIYNFINSNTAFFDKTVDIYQLGSEEFCEERHKGKVKLAFSSPPYFNMEIYDNSEKQAYYNGYYSFVNCYYHKGSSFLPLRLRYF